MGKRLTDYVCVLTGKGKVIGKIVDQEGISYRPGSSGL